MERQTPTGNQYLLSALAHLHGELAAAFDAMKAKDARIAELEAAVNASRTCDVYFSIGTSGVVQPAASLAHAARNKGSVVVEINAEPTPLTPKVDFAFHGKSGEILPKLVEAAWG